MNAFSRLAFVLTIIAAAVSYLKPDLREVASISVVIAAGILWITREIGHARNKRLRAQVLQLGGSLKGLDSKVDNGHPSRHTAAAISGQGELATWNYNTLVERLREDGHIN